MTLLFREGLENQEAKALKDEMRRLDSAVPCKTLRIYFLFFTLPSEVEIQISQCFQDEQ